MFAKIQAKRYFASLLLENITFETELRKKGLGQLEKVISLQRDVLSHSPPKSGTSTKTADKTGSELVRGSRFWSGSFFIYEQQALE